MSYIGDMDTYLIISVLKLNEGNRIVEILCICRIDGECQYIPEIPSSLQILGSNLLRYGISRISDLLFKAIRQ